ncbi:peptidase S8 [Paenibacillus ginsengarvi]|uniref:Peptidase S8 n=2 Tax=Paenibacillus ginsengarvi TaxID=400777 RepID=A0A3B0CMN5_9BACL|nr:peptidase S8 [Paenibacillus ginsengarvi]
MLHDAAGASSKRHIIHFRNKAAYSRFLTAFEKANELFPVKSVIQPIKIIHAISCSLKAGSFSLRHPSIRHIEEDIAIRVHSSHARYMQSSVAPRQSDSAIPWGVRQIRSPEAWKETRGSRIRIGVIDTGIDYSHPDLRGRISRGINLLNRALLPADDNGHGTHISGTIAASNPESGIVGVAPYAIIHPVKAFDHNGTAYVSDIVLGIDWCVRNRMHIINMSFGMKNRSKSLQDAVRSANRMGIAVVASSGNEGKVSSIDYPARFSQVISVGATTSHKKIAPFSNRGRSIDLYAPGDKIKSTWLNHKYMELSGTSMATSHVSGVIALMLAIKPGLSPAEIKSMLQKTSNPIAGLKSRSGVKGGEIDAVRVLKHIDS